MKTTICVFAVVLMLTATAFSQKRKAVPAAPKKATAVAPRVAEAPLDESILNAERLPTNFTGNNFDVIKALVPTTATEQKGEFESTQAYKDRLDRVPETVLTGKLRLDSTLGFVRTSLNSKYDADNEVLTVTLPVGQASLDLFLSRLDSSYRTVLLSRDRQVLGTYVGQNAFGAKKEITRVEDKSRFLVFRNYAAFREYSAKSSYDTARDDDFSIKYDFGRTKDLEFRLALAPSAAESAKSALGALFIFKLASPYAGVSVERSEPKMDYPTDGTDYQNYLVGDISQIWLYNRFTGEVYKKIVGKGLTAGTLDVKTYMVAGGAVLVLDKSMKDIITESGATAMDTFGKTPLHDLYGTLVAALAQQNNLKYKDFVAKVLPSIQQHTKASTKPNYGTWHFKDLPFGEYYVFGLYSDLNGATMVWDSPLSMRSEYKEVELRPDNATVKFDPGTRLNH